MARFFAPRRRRNRCRPAVDILPADMELDPNSNTRLLVPLIYSLQTRISRLPFLKVTIGENTVTALLDSGVTISYMRMSTLAALGNHIAITTQKLTATTANGTKIQLPGSTRLPIQIGTHTILHQFHIAADHECPAPLLLGSDSIRALSETGFALSTDLHNQTLTIGSDIVDLVQIHHIAFAPTKTYDVRITEDSTLARRTNNIVPARVDGILQPMCKAFLIEDNLRAMDNIFVVGRALVSPARDGNCFINILNPSNRTCTCQEYSR
ncbi:retroviral aspartyl protease [Ancylostoma duodenale]|uniref:Retroviral aspartyl protease n=1 Tax=Ancylostoma duodenale TaxID=51022 RepID=A0A0C2D8H4_9BILA|nr:retroviral aspartyl protease [Ancylostoma duodenale]